MTPCADGFFTLQHTETRKLELWETIDKLATDRRATPKDLERLHGRLIWFSAFIFGRAINQLVKQVSTLSLKREKTLVFDADFLRTLGELRTMIGSAKPVPVSRAICKTWIIFTDGAFEPGSDFPGSVGGVLVSPQGTPVQCFGETVPGELLEELLQHSDHPIYQ